MTNKEMKEAMDYAKLTEMNIANTKAEIAMIEAHAIGFVIGFMGAIIISIIRLNKKLKKGVR